MPKSRKRQWKGRDRTEKRLRANLRKELRKRYPELTIEQALPMQAPAATPTE